MTTPIQNYQGPLAMYDLLNDYYLSNGLYSDVAAVLKNESKWGESMRPLRNPANRVVEFYVSKLWAGTLDGSLPLAAKRASTIPAIEQIWKWSNWSASKQRFSRWFSLFGDGFLKVAENPERTRVYFQVLDPRWITDFRVDERGYLSFIRIDTQYEKADDKGKPIVVWWTEVWTKDKRQIWENHTKGRSAFKELGTPTKDEVNDLGFVPIVHAPFRDIGEVRGVGCFVHSLDKIDELNRMVTRLHQTLFRYNKPLWAIESESPKAGVADKRPKPPRFSETGTLNIEDESLLGLPPGSNLKLLIPDIRYESALAIIMAMQEEIEYDLPELKYYQLNKSSAMSGVALRYMLGDAIDRVVEARGNAYAALVRANEIALTIAQRIGLEGFSEAQIGLYEAGDFEHSITDVPVIPMSETDRATTLNQLVGAGIDILIAMKECGFTDEQVALQESIQEEKKNDRHGYQYNPRTVAIPARR